MQVAMVTTSGEAHGLINTLTNSVPFDDFKSMTPANKVKMQKEKKEDARIVKAEYLNSRGRHERLVKPYCKYAGEPILIYNLIPGRVYDLPIGLIKEVNDTNKILKKRSGLVPTDKDLDSTGAPLDKDEEGDWLHKLIPVGF